MGLLLGLVVRCAAPSFADRVLNMVHRRYEKMYRSIELAEWWMDTGARMVTTKAWIRGLITQGGLQGAHKAAAGLA